MSGMSSRSKMAAPKKKSAPMPKSAKKPMKKQYGDRANMLYQGDPSEMDAITKSLEKYYKPGVAKPMPAPGSYEGLEGNILPRPGKGMQIFPGPGGLMKAPSADPCAACRESNSGMPKLPLQRGMIEYMKKGGKTKSKKSAPKRMAKGGKMKGC